MVVQILGNRGEVGKREGAQLGRDEKLQRSSRSRSASGGRLSEARVQVRERTISGVASGVVV